MNGTLPLWLAAGLYCWMAVNYINSGQYGMSLAFLGYVIGNIGFIVAFAPKP